MLDTGEPFVGHEFLIPLDRDRDGVVEDCWFTFVYQPLKDPNGATGGIVVIAVDVATHVHARQELSGRTGSSKNSPTWRATIYRNRSAW